MAQKNEPDTRSDRELLVEIESKVNDMHRTLTEFAPLLAALRPRSKGGTLSDVQRAGLVRGARKALRGLSG